MHQSSGRLRRLALSLPLAAVVALVVAAAAWAHAEVSPAVVKAGASQVFTVAVPTEKENLTTTAVTLTPPSNFRIDSFAPSPGWKRKVVSRGSGENEQIERVTWSGGSVPHEEDAIFQFLGSAENAKTYSFTVQQTYSDGSVVDWSGPESSDTPAPTIEAKSSLGGGGTSVLSIVAIALAGIALLVAGVGLFARGGRELA
jgi:uncharacterized protein YcnI